MDVKLHSYNLKLKESLFSRLPFPLRKYAIICILFAVFFTSRLFAQIPPANFSSVTVSSNWNQAVGLTFSKSGDQMFVWEKAGKVWVMENNIKSLLIDISPEVGNWNDFGLLGFALHPDFEINGYFYLFYTVDRHHLMNFGTGAYSATANEYNNSTIGRLTRYTATKKTNGYDVNLGSRKILIGETRSTGIPSLYKSHGIGSVLFGSDGTLLISAGDGASFISYDGGSDSVTYYASALADGIITGQENVGAFRSQLLESYDGKILRIDPETGDGIPSNPFYETNNPNSIRSKVWALGFRNPFRMILKPNSGSINSADGNPGTLYVADVGYSTWEEINAVTKKGQNFGWPLFEGLTPVTRYTDLITYNQFTANPLFGFNDCIQQYFYFQDLIRQETASGTAAFTNPCNTAQLIPNTINTFLHTRPLIDFKHGTTGPSRTGIFSGETAAEINIGAPGSPVSGPQFSGNAAIAGCFYTHDDFPAEYKNSLFFGDYAAGWIRNLTVNGSNRPVAVKNFIDNGSIVVAMAIHPTQGGLYYVNYPSQIKKVSYTNQLPVAVATSNKTFGPSPLSIQFSGSSSTDPDGRQLSYLWNFGDGATSTLINPQHIFVTDTITQYHVTLTVQDSLGSADQDSLIISVNNTPPNVTIVSPVNNSLYPMNADTTYTLRATVTDAEHNNSQLSYNWVTFLHHDNHSHPEPVDTAHQTTTVISPIGCGEATYYYRIVLTVTDAGGLATTKEVRLYPDCSNVGNPPANSAPVMAPIGPRTVTVGETLSFTASATEPDHNQTTTFSLINAPQGASINPASGFFSWTPAQSGVFTFTVKVTDNGSPVKSDEEQVTVTVNNVIPVNNAPVLIPIGNQTATVGQTLSFTATASDADAGQAITFSLGNGAPQGASINPASGVFTWSPAQAGSYTLTVRITDNGSPVLTDEEQIIVIVNAVDIERLSPVADAFVRDGSYGQTNFGTNAFLQVKGSVGSGFMRSTFLKFSLSGVSSVGVAKLRIYGNNIDDNTSVNMSIYEVNSDTWTETGITFNNAPAALTAASGVVSVDNVPKYYEFDVTNFVKAQFGGDKVVTFVLKDPGNLNKTLQFNSKENTQNKPQLVIESGVNDVTPPVVNVQFNGTYNAPNTYNNQVEVVVNATDAGGSGLASTQYSLNRGAYQTYTAPFIINTLGNYTITARAIDGKGNTGVTSEIAFTVVSQQLPPTTQTLSPVADAFVRDGSYGQTNFGSNGFLQVKGSVGIGFMRSTFLKFSLSGISSVGIAKLRIYGNNIDDNTNVNISIYGVNTDTWTETGITFDNAPAALTPVLGVVGVSSPNYYEIDVTNFVISQFGGDKVVTLLIKDPGNLNKTLQFNSKENAQNKPQLVIESAANDVTPPVVNVQFNGTSNSPNTYNNRVEVVVNASDAGGSGLASTQYSLNRGAYQNYTAPLNINTLGNYTITAKAIDGKGNTTVTNEIAFTVVFQPPQPVIVTLSPGADAYVRDGSYAQTNFGTNAFLQVKGSVGSGFMRSTFLKFSLSGVSSVSTAKLRVYGNNTDDNTSINMSVYGVNNDTWTETGITFNNAPVALAPALGVVGVSVFNYYEIDVTSFVNSQLGGDRVVTFAIKDPANLNRNLQFNSKENAQNKPQLIIESLPPLITRRE